MHFTKNIFAIFSSVAREGLLLAVVLTAMGCAVKVPPVSTYVLTTPVHAASSEAAQTSAVLLVGTMTADPGYKTSAMIYLKEPAHLREFARNAWVAPPAQMFMPLLIEGIESRKYFRAVVTPPFAGHSDYRLDTRLVMLQQEFMQPESQVRCVVSALLTNNNTGRVIASHLFRLLYPRPAIIPPVASPPPTRRRVS